MVTSASNFRLHKGSNPTTSTVTLLSLQPGCDWANKGMNRRKLNPFSILIAYLDGMKLSLDLH